MDADATDQGARSFKKEMSRLHDDGVIDTKTAEAAGAAPSTKRGNSRRKSSNRNPKSS
jgi:hypothetical protein